MLARGVMSLIYINGLDRGSAQQAFLNCCGAERWAQEMADGRPYGDALALARQTEGAWTKMTRADWLEAFGAHAKIGDIESLKAKYGSTKGLSINEQSGVAGASQAVLEELAARNREYEERYGYIFIVCATGKTAEELLSILKERIVNAHDAELKNAIEQQKRITNLRLEKLL